MDKKNIIIYRNATNGYGDEYEFFFLKKEKKIVVFTLCR